MPHEHEQMLYLSKDRKYLTDRKGHVILTRKEKDGTAYYQSIGIQSEAYEKACTEVSPRKVCVLWNGAYQCREFDEVDVCTMFEMVSVSYGNIS